MILKRRFCLTLVFAAILSLCACSGGGDGGDTETAVADSPGSATTVQTAATTTAGIQPTVQPTPATPTTATTPTTTATTTPPAAPAPLTPTQANPNPQAQIDVDLRAAMTAGGVVQASTPPAQDPAKVALGEALFFDKILSGNRDVACATCHQPGLATGDAQSVSVGTGFTGNGANRQLGPGRSHGARNSSPIFNMVGVDRMFWDGRVERTGNGFSTPAGFSLPAGLDSALAAQAMFPVTNRQEMRGNAGDTSINGQSNELAQLSDADLQAQWDAIMTRLRAIGSYQAMFRLAYPTVAESDLGFQHAANAIAAFETNRFQALSSPFDRYVAGDDTALSDAAKRGGQLFYGRARCSRCHTGPLLSDLSFHNIASPQVGPGNSTEAPLDFGRFNVSGDPQDRFRFRTAILRNVAVTGPWMHSGSYTSLANVVRHYRNPAAALNQYDPTQLRADLVNQVSTQRQIAAGVLNTLDPILVPPIALNNAEVADLVSFLESLTDPNAVNNSSAPASVPSGLPVGN